MRGEAGVTCPSPSGGGWASSSLKAPHLILRRKKVWSEILNLLHTWAMVTPWPWSRSASLNLATIGSTEYFLAGMNRLFSLSRRASALWKWTE
jgi:hypothetical protein